MPAAESFIERLLPTRNVVLDKDLLGCLPSPRLPHTSFVLQIKMAGMGRGAAGFSGNVLLDAFECVTKLVAKILFKP